jgi:hypothetical protein
MCDAVWCHEAVEGCRRCGDEGGAADKWEPPVSGARRQQLSVWGATVT